jgi:hypothetical protein
MDRITPHLLAWQFDHYASAHRSRLNLAVHAVAVPLFAGGVILLLLSPAVAWWLALVGAAAMAVSVGVQGRGHARESERPAPFLSPLDLVARLFVEQLVTFPRFVLSGGFARAWREGAPYGTCSASARYFGQ